MTHRPITSANRIYHATLAAIADANGEALSTREISERINIANLQKVSRAARALLGDGLVICDTTLGKDPVTWRLSDSASVPAALERARARLSVPAEDQRIRQHVADLPAGTDFDIADVTIATDIHHIMVRIVLLRMADEGVIVGIDRSRFRTRDGES
jgi:hypothetical protein